MIFNSTDPKNNDPKPFVHSNGNRFSADQARLIMLPLTYAPREEFNETRRYPTNTILADFRVSGMDQDRIIAVVNTLKSLIDSPNGTSDEVRHSYDVLSRMTRFF